MQELHVARSCAPTLRELWAIYIEKKTLRPKTIDLYKRALRWGVDDWMDQPIDQITKRMIADRHEALSKKNGPRGSGKDAANLTFRTLKSLLNFAEERLEAIEENPVIWLSDAKAWNRTRKRKDLVKDHQLPIWFEKVLNTDERDCRDYLLILLFMAFRRSEGRQLQWFDVDFQANMITARATKNGTDHTLPMSQYVLELLSRRYWFMNPRPDDFIFPGRYGRGCLSDNYKGYQKLWDEMGFPFRLHSLRRTALTAGAKEGIPLIQLKWIANHENDADITNRYLIKDPEILREPIEKISQRLQRFIPLARS